MRSFVRVVEAGSLSGAARQLRSSLPAVSRQLRALESELRTTLIVRTTRTMSVTDAGRAYYERAARILAEIDEAHDIVRDSGVPAGKLVVSAPVTLGLARIAPELPKLFARYPRLQVDLGLDDRAVDLVADGVDVAVRAGMAPPDSSHVMARPVMRWRRILVASPAYLKKHGTPGSLRALADHAALIHVPSRGRPGSWELVIDGEPTTVEVRGPFSTNALAAIADACRAGTGIAFLPEWLVERDIASRRMKRVLPQACSAEIVVHAVYRREHRASLLVRTFVDFLAGLSNA